MKKTQPKVLTLLLLVVSSWWIHPIVASSGTTTSTTTPSTSSNSLPRSNSIPRSSSSSKRRLLLESSANNSPPWNPSPHIDSAGFLTQRYNRRPGEWEQEVRLRTIFSTDTTCRVRQVPGDGNCLFHSISLCLEHAVNKTHLSLTKPQSLEQLYLQSQLLRKQAVECLRQNKRRLFLQGHDTLRAYELVQAAAQQYDLTAEEYCDIMQQDCVWGGGPEIVALCNVLQRPIHVYELAVEGQGQGSSNTATATSNTARSMFVLRRMACFGSPRFDRNQPLHILSADSRFPDLQPGQQMAAGNHFLALFPDEKRRKRLRGGGAEEEEDYMEEMEVADRNQLTTNENETSVPWTKWWNQLSQYFGR